MNPERYANLTHHIVSREVNKLLLSKAVYTGWAGAAEGRYIRVDEAILKGRFPITIYGGSYDDLFWNMFVRVI